MSVLQLAGTTERPRLAVFRSNNHIYAQVSAQQYHEVTVQPHVMLGSTSLQQQATAEW